MSLDKHERRVAAWTEEGERPLDPEAVSRSGTRDLAAARLRGYRSTFDHGGPPDDRARFTGAPPEELRQTNPENRWDGPWSGQAVRQVEEALGASDARLTLDPARLGPMESALAVEQARARDGQRLDAPLGTPQTVEGLVERVDQQIAAIDARAARPVPGENIVPGSIPVSALAPRAFGARLGLPGPRAAVTLRLAPDPDTDHWAVDGASVGPGRVWRVTSVEEGPDFQPDGGPVRFRVVGPRQRFGVISVELQNAGIDTGDPRLQTNYGIFIRGIPTYGLGPERILAALAEGDYPVPYATTEVSTGGTPDGPYSLLGDAAQERYQTSSPAFMDELDSDSWLSPQASGIDRCEGFSFALIRGRTDEAVYRELNTRATTYGRTWRTDGALEGLTLPTGSLVRPPCPGQTMEWNGQVGGTSPGYDQITQANTATENRLVEGIPILYPDCAALARRPDSFSMVVQPLVIRSKTLSASDTWPSPANWASYGVETVDGDDRTWALDVIVH